MKKYFSSKHEISTHILKNDTGLSFEFLASNGAVRKISLHDVMVNLFMAHPLEGGVANIFIRTHDKSMTRHVPVIGPGGESQYALSQSAVIWTGEFRGLRHKTVLAVSREANAWFYEVSISNTTKKNILCDLVYLQDKGISDECTIRINEAYTSQYIDQKVFRHKKFGPVVAARQNHPFKDRCPWMLDGCLDGSTGFLTDGLQFYGLDYKGTNVPAALAQKEWKSEVLQDEFSITALKSKAYMIKPGTAQKVRYFGFVLEDHREATTERDLKHLDGIEELCLKALESVAQERVEWRKIEKSVFNNVTFFPAIPLSGSEIDALFGKTKRHVETDKGKLVSFFTGRSHAVTKEKDLALARTHGNIIRAGREIFPETDVLSSVHFIYGLFNAHLTVGNTSFDQLLSHPRSLLNILKASGQRIFVRSGRCWEMLGLPSAYEMGLTFGRWIYKGKDRLIEVKTWTDPERPVAYLEINVLKGKKTAFLITHEITLGGAEFEQRGWLHFDSERGVVEATPDKSSFLGTKRPGSKFFIAADGMQTEKIGMDELLYCSGQTQALPYIVFLTKETASFQLALGGSVESPEKADALCGGVKTGRISFEDDVERSTAYWRGVLRNVWLALPQGTPGDRKRLDKINDILPWYLHNAGIHFTVPFGLEQYKGGAWGVRDVLQGPVEALLPVGQDETVRHMLRKVFSAQFIETGNWPQWFMFDTYKEIQLAESHGDIIVWPFKAVCEYIEATNDFSLLDERLPYTREHEPLKPFTEDKETVFQHLMRAVACIKKNFIPGTHLSSYAGGDWDDTLQPANRELRERMASGWTVSITYQYIRAFADILRRTDKRKEANELADLAQKIRADYHTYMMKDNLASGFIHLAPDGTVEYMLHPRDERTHIKYRLLPMTRGIISEFFTKEEMERHYGIIEKHLACPDGVRLMDTTVPYSGGPVRWFRRAEMAANFGREIGLMYVHAHLRYVEALAKIGKGDELFQNLLKVIPISIRDDVPNAVTRQANAYFSSSDGNFKTRYDVDFAKLKKGLVPVKGGWRIYSSGPGLFIRQILSNFLGIRTSFGHLAVDPVIPARFDGLIYQFDYAKGKALRCVYKTGGKRGCGVSKMTLNGEPLPTEPLENPYRKAGVKVPLSAFEKKLKQGVNELVITL